MESRRLFFFWLNRDVLVIYKSYQFRFFPLEKPVEFFVKVNMWIDRQTII